jgi:hypothetical protein
MYADGLETVLPVRTMLRYLSALGRDYV